MEGHKLVDEHLVVRGKKVHIEHVKPFGKLEHGKITHLTPLSEDD
jgi:hypothetical protein